MESTVGTTMNSAGGQGPMAGGTAGASNTGAPANSGTTSGTADVGAGGQSAGAGGSDAGGAANGGATLGGATGSAGSAPVSGLPGTSTFTRLTIRSVGSYVDQATGACESVAPGFEDGATPSVWSFDRGSRMFTWEYCKGYPGMFERSGRALSDVEAQGILNALNFVSLSSESGCIADAGGSELELEVDGTTTIYRPDWGWCGSGPNDQNYVSGLSPLWSWLEWLTDPVVIPDAPETLELSTGEVPDGPFPNPECSENPHPVVYELDVATGTLSWRGSSAPEGGGTITFCPTEMRMLEAHELDSVLRAYLMLGFGVSAPCANLEPPESLNEPNGQVAWVTIDVLLELTDEVASCYSGARGPYAIGVAELSQLVADLAN
ncbi:MAG TPA: hypothetical protein VFU02_09270 [Polyangiaceae bacterium]|nr:hypothetical protein [Polyangiaceae bacterium]